MNDPVFCIAAGCTKLARLSEARGLGPGCNVCCEILCPKHLVDHPCETPDWEAWHKQQDQQHSLWIQSIVESFPTIKAAAQELRPGQSVDMEVPSFNYLTDVQDRDDVDMQGNCNVHIPMHWDDEPRWLARIKMVQPRELTTQPWTGLDKYVQNEHAIMQVGHRILGDLVPRPWVPRERIGDLDMLFVERVSGVIEPRLRGGWKYSVKDGVRSPPLSSAATLSSFPDIVEKLVDVPFEGIGTFWPNDDDLASPILGPVMGGGGTYRLVGLYGPFATFAEFIDVRLRSRLNDLDDGTLQVKNHDPALYYLAQLELRDLINTDPDMMSLAPTYIFHADYWQMMFDAERTRVVGIIDWEYAHTAPLPLVLEAPFLWIWGSKAVLRDGPPSNELNALEKDMLATFRARGRDDIAATFMKRHKYSRAMRSKLNAQYLWLRRQAFLGDQAGPKPGSDDEWIALARERYGQDEGFKAYEARIAAEVAAAAA